MKNLLHSLFLATICFFFFSSTSPTLAQGFEGYYRYPDIQGDQVIFTAEGDIWKVSLQGGLAQRLTSHAEQERWAHISPDGKTIAFSASYEGPTEVYTMPITGGLPTRWTYESDFSIVNGWTPDGKVVYDTRAFSTLPDRQLVTLDPQSKAKTRIPLSQASEASFSADGKTVFFVRPSFHGNVTKRYEGGTARQIWKFTEGSPEAIKLTKDSPRESHHPMCFEGRVYFLTARDGIMNIWSMDEDGNDLKQHTEHTGFDAREANLSGGNIVYQLGADIWHYNIAEDKAQKIPITLATDLHQLQEKWVDKPANYITSVHPDKSGEKIVITARGRVFVAPVKSGRFVEFTDNKNVRFRNAIFSADGNQVITLSDESGEFEFISMPANGIGDHRAITSDGAVLRYGGKPSPDGKWLVYDDLERHLFLLNLETGEQKIISTKEEGINQFSWSPDSKWIAFGQRADNTMNQLFIYSLENGDAFPITTDRANSMNPAWSPDGKFIYFLSDRSFTSLVGGPWGPRQPEAYFDASEKLYHIALQKETRSPFRPQDELMEKKEDDKADSKDKEDKSASVTVVIDREGILQRMEEVPIKPGNYYGLAVNKKAIYMMSRETGVNAKSHLAVVKVGNEEVKLKTMVREARSFELSADGKKLLVRKQNNYLHDRCRNWRGKRHE